MISLKKNIHEILFLVFHLRDVLDEKRSIGNLRRWNVKNIDKVYKNKPEGILKEVPITYDFNKKNIYENFILKKIPVVLKKAAINWRASKLWSFDYFKNEYKEYEVHLAKEEFIRTKKQLSYKIYINSYKMPDFVNDVYAGESLYLKFSKILTDYPELIEHLDTKSMLEWSNNRDRKYEISNEFYMGGKGSITNLHTERSDIFHVCIKGKKRWRLYGPENSRFLYPVPAKTFFIASEVDFINPDYDIHPWFKYANGYETILEEGDVLYFPSYFWHGVENLTPTISANYLWYVPVHAIHALPFLWLISKILHTSGAGTIDQFIKLFSGKSLINLHS